MGVFGDRLRHLRKVRNMKISSCANQLGVSPSTYRDWEYGRSISGEPYVELSKLFNVSLTELLTGETQDLASHLEEVERSLEIALRKVRELKAVL